MSVHEEEGCLENGEAQCAGRVSRFHASPLARALQSTAASKPL